MSSNSNANSNEKESFQYATTTPSISSLLNLPKVEKKTSNTHPQRLLPTPQKKTPGTLSTNKVLGLAGPSKGILQIKKVEKSVPVILESNVKISGQASLPVDTDKLSTSNQKSTNITPANIDSKNINKSTTPKAREFTKNLNEKVISKKTGHSKQLKTSTTKEWQDPALADWDQAHWRLFVGNLGPEVSDSLLLSTFQLPFPSASRAHIVRDRKTEKSKGYGFVAFAVGKEYLRALKEMQGRWIGNRQCIIKKSEFQPKFQ